MKSSRLLIVLSLFVVAAAYLLFVTPQGQETTRKVFSWAPLSTSSVDAVAKETPNPTQTSASAEPAPSVSPEFVQKFSDEAGRMERFSGDTASQEGVLRSWAQTLTPPQIQFLKTKALSQQGSANDRILGTYLLTLAAGEAGTQALQEVVLAPLQVPTDFAVHSPEEVLSAQEKALRRMAVDSLAERARNAGSSEDLERTFEQIQDPILREYAKKALKKRP